MSVDAHDLERAALQRKDREQLQAIAQAMGRKPPSRARKDQIIELILDAAGLPTGGSSASASAAAAASAAPASTTTPSQPVAAPPAVAETPRLPFDTPASGPADAERGQPEAVAAVPAVSRPAEQVEPRSAAADAPADVAPAVGQPTDEPRADGPRSRPQPDSGRGDLRRGDGGFDRARADGRPDGGARPAGRFDGARDARSGDAGDQGGQDGDEHDHDGDHDGDGRSADGRSDGGEDGRSSFGDASGEREGGSRRRRRRGRDKDRIDRGGPTGFAPSQPGERGDDGPAGRDQPTAAPAGAAAPAPAANASGAPGGNAQGGGQHVGPDAITVSGFLDLREEGYGFLRVRGYLASKEDVYVPAKYVRQFSLRKGDQLTGVSRPAGRGEKNPALLRVDEVNGADPELARSRPRFEDLTPLFPDTPLRLSRPEEPFNMTARIVDLISPIGKGQRGLIVSPPKAGKTTIMKTIAQAIEANNPEVKLMILLVDERPEEVTDMRRSVRGEVVASTFDRPADEHTHVAEMTIERAKRLVESGHDVVIIVDGITRLARAYNIAAPATGRVMSGGIDTGALYPPKKFFGAARNVEEGGSLTILATALVETGSRMDEVIFEEFKGTGNMELRLDRRLAEKRIYPAIDVDASSTRHEELLFDRRQLQGVWRLRRVLSGVSDNSGAGLELLIDRMKSFKTNDEFLAEVAKAPSN